jgi:hypothetical protein
MSKVACRARRAQAVLLLVNEIDDMLDVFEVLLIDEMEYELKVKGVL